MKKIYILVFIASTLTIGAQTTVNYPHRIANYDATFTDGGGNFDDGTDNFGMWANSAAKQSVAFRNFTETGLIGGTATTMAVGDSFTITVSATQAYGVIGLALLSSPSATASWDDRINNYAVQVNLNGNSGAYDPWEVVSTAGTINASSIGGSTSYADFEFKFTLSTATTMNISINNGAEVFDITLNNENITGYSVYIMDDWNGSANNNIFWKPTTEYVYATTDTSAPVITLTGDPVVTIEVDSTYADEGATALDNYDGDITTTIVETGTVDASTVGVYTLSYNVTDASGNVAVEVTRTVNVVDTTIPVITLTGDPIVTIEVDSTYADEGATALDNYDGDITTTIVETGTVDASTVGVYTLSYNVTDASGNVAVEVTRTVNVVDTTIPVITLTGDPIVTIEVDSTYADEGATALDNYDGDITTTIIETGAVDASTVGGYTLSYNVTDAAGNVAVEVTRTVNVTEVLGLNSAEINTVSVYPNPTTSNWTVESLSSINSVKIFNLLGQKVLEQKANDTKVNIDTSVLKTGVYMLQINNTAMKRLIKN